VRVTAAHWLAPAAVNIPVDAVTLPVPSPQSFGMPHPFGPNIALPLPGPVEPPRRHRSSRSRRLMEQVSNNCSRTAALRAPLAPGRPRHARQAPYPHTDNFKFQANIKILSLAEPQVNLRRTLNESFVSSVVFASPSAI